MRDKIRLSKMLYSFNDIMYCIEQYNEICHITLSDDLNYYICIFNNCKYDINDVINEFENYLIGYVNLKARSNDIN